MLFSLHSYYLLLFLSLTVFFFIFSQGGLVRVINGQFSSSSSSPFAGTNLMIKTLIDPYEGKIYLYYISYPLPPHKNNKKTLKNNKTHEQTRNLSVSK